MKCPECDHVQKASVGRVCQSCRYVYRLDQKVWVDWVHGWEHIVRAES